MTDTRKCCPNHITATNRADRRAANKHCPCRGECGWHGGHTPSKEEQ